MDLDAAMRTTAAVREFTADPVPDAMLYDILEVARFAPSGGNRQGNRVVIVRDAETRDALAKLAEPAAKRYAAQIKAGENPWNAVNPTKVTPDVIAATRAPAALTESFRNAPVCLVFLVDLGVVASMDQDLDRVGMISGASIYPFVWNVLLAARAAGLGGTITTLAAAEEPKLQALLQAPAHFAVAAVVPLGKPVKQLTKLRRNSVEQIAKVGAFDGPDFVRP